MKAHNLSVQGLEKKAGLNVHAVRNILKNRIKNPRAETLQAIAEALGCTILDLMNISPSASESYLKSEKQKDASLSNIINNDLIKSCGIVVCDILIKNNYSVTVGEYIDILRDVYTYSLKNSSKDADETFAEWIIENNIEVR